MYIILEVRVPKTQMSPESRASGNPFVAPHVYIYIYIYIYTHM